MSGFLLLVLLGSIAGCAAGARASAGISAQSAGKSYFDATYTAGAPYAVKEVEVEEVQMEDQWFLAAGCAAAITAAGAGIALAKMNRSLKREPMELLAERDRE